MTGSLGRETNLMINQAAVGVQNGVDTILSPFRAFQAVLTCTTGNCTAAVNVEGSNDGINWVVQTTLTFTSNVSPQTQGYGSQVPYKFQRFNVTAISGTGALVNGIMCI